MFWSHDMKLAEMRLQVVLQQIIDKKTAHSPWKIAYSSENHNSNMTQTRSETAKDTLENSHPAVTGAQQKTNSQTSSSLDYQLPKGFLGIRAIN